MLERRLEAAMRSGLPKCTLLEQVSPHNSKGLQTTGFIQTERGILARATTTLSLVQHSGSRQCPNQAGECY